jgi:hypothetical protein
VSNGRFALLQQDSCVDATWLALTPGEGVGDGLVGGAYNTSNKQQTRFVVSMSHRSIIDYIQLIDQVFAQRNNNS